MKKIVLLIVMMFISMNVQALTGNIEISCANSIELNEEKNCSISGYSDGKISAVSARLKVKGTINVSNIAVDSIWQGDGEDGNILIYTDVNKTGTFNIATFSIIGTSIGAGSIDVSNVVFSDDKFNDITISNKSKSIKVENYESPIYAIAGKCNNITYTGEKQALTSDGKFVTYENNLQTNAGSYEVNVTANSGYTFDNGTTSKVLNCKINKANIKVIKENYNGKYDGEKHTFELSSNPSSNVEIFYNTTLSLTNKNYTTIGSKEKPEISEEGETIVYYYIHDKSGNYNDYSSVNNKNNALITIEKLDLVKNSDATLKALKINDIEIELLNEKYDYTIETKDKEIIVIAVANNSKAKVEIPKALKVANKINTYEIKVTAEDGTVLIYKINVKRNAINKRVVVLGFIAIAAIGTAIILNKIKSGKR